MMSSFIDPTPHLEALNLLVRLSATSTDQQEPTHTKIQEFSRMKQSELALVFPEVLFWVNRSLEVRPDEMAVRLFFDAYPKSPLIAIVPTQSMPGHLKISSTPDELQEKLVIYSHLRIGVFNVLATEIAQRPELDKADYLWSLACRVNDQAFCEMVGNVPDYSKAATHVGVLIDALTAGISAWFLGGLLPAFAMATTAGVTSKVVRMLRHPQCLDRSAKPEELAWQSLSAGNEIEYAFEPKSSGTKRFVTNRPSATLGRIRIAVGATHLFENFNLNASEPLDVYSANNLAENLAIATFKKSQLAPSICLTILETMETIAIGSRNVTLLNQVTRGCIFDLKARCMHDIAIALIDPLEARIYRYPPGSFSARFYLHLPALEKIKGKVEKHALLLAYTDLLLIAIRDNEPLLLFRDHSSVSACKRGVGLQIHPDRIEAEYRDEATALSAIYSNIFLETKELPSDWVLL